MAKALRHIRETATKWHVRFHDRNRSPSEVTFSFDKASFSTRQIERKRDELRYLWQNGDWDPWTKRLPGDDGPQYVTLRGAVDAYCAHKRLLGQRGLKGGWNAKTHQDCQLELRFFARTFGPNKLVHRLSDKDVEAWIFDPSIKPASQAKRRRVLKTFLAWLKNEGLIERIPEMGPPFVERELIPDYYTEAEMLAICAVHEQLCREHAAQPHVPKEGARSPLAKLWMSEAYKFTFYQGLRLGELFAMRVRLVDLERKYMFVGDAEFIPKGKDQRIITITPPARSVIRVFLAGKEPHERVWPPCQPDRLSKHWKAALRRSIEDKLVPAHKAHMNFHDLRKSCCEYWLNEKRIPIDKVQELLRHKKIETTLKHYKSTNVEAQTALFEV